jgi:LPS-assembly lipoprotein
MSLASSSIWSSADAGLLRFAASLALLLLAGCGFQLRGVGVTANIEPLHVTAARETAAFDTLVHNLELSGVDVLDAPTAGAWSLTLLEEREEERVVSVTERGLAADFELSVELSFQVEDAAGLMLIAPQQVTVSRVYRQDPDNLAGSSRERELLLSEMHRELAQQIVRSLNAAVQSGTTGASHAGPTR